jgi:hypothetical protein
MFNALGSVPSEQDIAQTKCVDIDWVISGANDCRGVILLLASKAEVFARSLSAKA